MTPGARLAAAVALAERFLADETSFAAPLLKRWAGGARYAGSKDRAAVADHFFAALRRLESARLGASAPDGRAAVLGALRLEGATLEEIAALADGGPHRLAPLSAGERDRLRDLPAAAAEARWLDFPEVWRPALARSCADPTAEIAALRRRAAFDLRANALKTDRDGAAAALAEDGLETEPGPLSPTALRAIGVGDAARPKLSRARAYAEGLVEPQDAASQAAALTAAALLEDRRGIVVDACAGGGGKTLALAAAAPEARLHAFDVAPGRMAEAPERLARAGATAAVLDRRGLGALEGRSDLVLVDAPCSGSGAWARQPDAKWRLTAERLKVLGRMQAEALDLGASLVRPGGVLVYATCSLFAEENSDSLRAFVARRPAFAPEPIGPALAAARLIGAAVSPGDAPLAGASVTFSPARYRTEGFFVAALRRVVAR